jgi:hypothetical protein
MSSLPLPRNLRTSIYDVAFYSLMVGLGECYITAYAMALGLNERNAGLIAVVPVLIGSIVQLLSPFAIRMLRSRQRWIVICAISQAFALVCIGLIGPTITSIAARQNYLFLAASIYWSAALAAGPAWASWITHIVPVEHSTKFFTVRTKTSQGFIFFGLVASGAVLHFLAVGKSQVNVFASLFMLAAIARLTSAFFIARQMPKVKASEQVIRELSEPVASKGLFQSTTAIPTILFMFFTNIAVQISAPFFTPYMLDEMKLDYVHYMILISSIFIGRIAAMHICQHLVDRIGIKAIMIIGAIGVVPSAGLWIVSQNFWYALTLQILAGFAWGSHELGYTLMLMSQLKEKDRGRVLTISNLMNSVGMIAGSSFGAWMLGSGNPNAEEYYVIFVLSSCARLLPLFMLPTMLTVQLYPTKIFMKILGVRVGSIGMAKPIVVQSNPPTSERETQA